MVVKIRQRRRTSIALFPIPYPHIVLSAPPNKQCCAKWLVPMSHRAQLIVGRQREFRWDFSAAIGATRSPKTGRFEMLENVWR